ncbi:MAG: S8 family serine peptidase, partial [Bacteroidia bacterium]|nr:S8 family serine peptidase [Bacteroidia bacterium]
AVGPRNNQNATSGIAYKSSLHFIRGCDDVVLDESAELTGVKNALVAMGKIKQIKLISMSVGTPFYSSALYDGVVFAYNKGKMLIAAAGTSFSFTTWWGVIYPASFSQCVAVTGVKENGSTCSVCHDGGEVDFTIPMERDANSERNSLSLQLSGTTASYIGGSSAATATAAGIASLVWSVKPSLTRSQVHTILRNTSQYYPSSSSSHGYGNLNAGAAVALALTY